MTTDADGRTVDRAPTVSVGLAVYNGDAYLEEALESILGQTYPDFELIICDNASDDRTAEICEAAAERDSRVRYHRNATNIGGANNENLTFTKARGRYFRWAAHDDVLAPTLLERCVEVMDAEPDVVLCHSAVVLIDADGNRTGTVARHRRPDLPTWRLFADLTKIENGCEETYGLMRSDALAATGLQRNYTDSDRTLLAHMALLGGYREIDELLFYKRVHPANSMQVFPEWRDRMKWFGAEYATKITLPHWSQLAHYVQIIATAPVPFPTRVRCFGYMFVWVGSYRRWRSLAKDVVVASTQLARRAGGRRA